MCRQIIKEDAEVSVGIVSRNVTVSHLICPG